MSCTEIFSNPFVSNSLAKDCCNSRRVRRIRGSMVSRPVSTIWTISRVLKICPCRCLNDGCRVLVNRQLSYRHHLLLRRSKENVQATSNRFQPPRRSLNLAPPFQRVRPELEADESQRRGPYSRPGSHQTF